jgi:hypothetical protein
VAEISPEERRRIQRYLQLDEENLYPLLLKYSDEYKDKIASPLWQEEWGRKVFERLEGGLRQVLCVEWDMCERLNDQNVKDGTNLVVVIGDVIAAKVAGFPPFLIASLLVKIGLRRFCACP